MPIVILLKKCKNRPALGVPPYRTQTPPWFPPPQTLRRLGTTPPSSARRLGAPTPTLLSLRNPSYATVIAHWRWCAPGFDSSSCQTKD